jgi:hypothetical protein
LRLSPGTICVNGKLAASITDRDRTYTPGSTGPSRPQPAGAQDAGDGHEVAALPQVGIFRAHRFRRPRSRSRHHGRRHHSCERESRHRPRRWYSEVDLQWHVSDACPYPKDRPDDRRSSSSRHGYAKRGPARRNHHQYLQSVRAPRRHRWSPGYHRRHRRHEHRLPRPHSITGALAHTSRNAQRRERQTDGPARWLEPCSPIPACIR